MSFFNSLTAIGIDRGKLITIGDEDPIRTEKKLIALLKLSNSASKNDIENIMRVIKDYPDVLGIIGQYDCFYGILSGYEAEHLDILKKHSGEETERIQFVVANYLHSEILHYINLNLGSNNWNNLRVLLHYKIFLAPEIIKVLIDRLDGKLTYTINVIREKPLQTELEKKAGAINQADFFILLDETDNRYFDEHILKISNFIFSNAVYVKGSTFFSRLIANLYYYNPKNVTLRTRVNQASNYYAAPKRSPAKMVWAWVIFIITILRVITHLTSGPDTYTPNTTPINTENGDTATSNGNERQLAMQKVEMEGFVKARLYTANNPIPSRIAQQLKPGKYQNPFKAGIFNNSYHEIKHGSKGLMIFNRTLKDCIVIAYFNVYYDPGHQEYVSTGDDNIRIFYALYLPPGDSIKIDNQMYLLRFYTGKDLAVLKSSPGYNDTTPADAKFTRHDAADCLLFTKGFTFGNIKPKSNQRLTLSQPTDGSFKITWTGDNPLMQYSTLRYTGANRKPDSATRTKPLIIDLKRKRTEFEEAEDKPVNTFIN